MPTAYIYRGTFEVRAGETLRYREIVPDGTISPEVTRTYAELAGSGSIAAASVSLTPTVAAPTLTGVQIGAIAGVSVSLQPTVSPAAVSGVQVGSIAAAAVSVQPTVTAPSVTGIMVGNITAASVTCQPVVAVGTLTGVEQQASGPVTLSFETVDIVDSSGGTWEKVVPTDVVDGAIGSITSGVAGISGADGNCLRVITSVFDDGTDYYALPTYIRRTMNVGAGNLTLRFQRIGVASAASSIPHIKIGGTTYADDRTSLGVWDAEGYTVNIPSPLTGVEVQIGARAGQSLNPLYIDSVSIPQ